MGPMNQADGGERQRGGRRGEEIYFVAKRGVWDRKARQCLSAGWGQPVGVQGLQEEMLCPCIPSCCQKEMQAKG